MDCCLSSLTKMNSQQIKNLNVRPSKVKILQENIGKKNSDTGLGNDFLHMTLKAQVTVRAKPKCDDIKLKCFQTAKEISNKMKKQP